MSKIPETVVITQAQAARLMSVLVALRAEDIAIRGHDEEDVENALAALKDVGEECALQFGGLGNGKG